jgi:putative tryptophan/tyrosine transport system substrate-binding protein
MLVAVPSLWREDFMRRREFIAGIAGAAVTCAPVALAQEKKWRLGWLDPTNGPSDNLDAFKKALAGLGYVEEQNFVIEGRYAGHENSRLPALAKELVTRGVDIIVTIGTPSVAAAKSATATIPIVMAGSEFPVEHGFVASFAHPGGNITGVTHNPGEEFGGKCLELLKEVAPGIRRVALLWNSTGSPDASYYFDPMRAAAATLGLTILPRDVNNVWSADDFVSVFSAIKQEAADSLFVYPEFKNNKYAREITSFASANRLPAIYQNTVYTDVGGLICYYTNWLNLRRHAAVYVDKIIKGAKPADLPVERPTTYELVINMKAAEAIGLTIPRSVLLRADKVIE